jgi:hypothetical protein
MDLNTDRLCENCGHDWRGGPECPVCDHVTPPDAPPLEPEQPSMVTICSWCIGARERTDAAIAFGRIVTHGICRECGPKFLQEGRF